jgi:hypothetical protein
VRSGRVVCEGCGGSRVCCEEGVVCVVGVWCAKGVVGVGYVVRRVWCA